MANFYVCDNRDTKNKAQGPYSMADAKKLCSDLNDYVQRNIPAEQRKTMRERDMRPFTFGTKDDFAQFGKVIAAATSEQDEDDDLRKAYDEG